VARLLEKTAVGSHAGPVARKGGLLDLAETLQDRERLRRHTMVPSLASTCTL
jgi:hypothetical protein